MLREEEEIEETLAAEPKVEPLKQRKIEKE
jgi:hypothetical protein